MSIAAHQERLMTVLQGPHLSEKSHFAAEKNQIVFKVRTDATKSEIKAAVELLFEVEVEGVTVMNYQGKIKSHGTSKGRRVNWKKAYVRLAAGSQIDFLGGE
ncbi:MAG: 50S ribosomal protein L23 [Proteobacteria bacterium]|nr:50S ribosomal protein L23 [Pseudomonadota bacterium]MDA0994064.1 50S ribosomal protein L23 [Pseudomonadota bacterium]